MVRTHDNGSNNGAPAVFAVLATLCVLIGGLFLVTIKGLDYSPPEVSGKRMVSDIRITKLGVQVRAHSDKHAEAEPIRQCLDNSGAYKVYQAYNRDKYFLLCEWKLGEWGFQLVDKDGTEITAYQPEGVHSFNQLVDWLRSQRAMAFGKGLPWLNP